MENENITARLIKKGMGFTVAIPPNIQLLDCYQNAEYKAQKINAEFGGTTIVMLLMLRH